MKAAITNLTTFWMGLILFLIIMTLMPTMVAAKDTHLSTYVGKWKIIEIYDEDMKLVDLPKGEFFFEIEEADSGTLQETNVEEEEEYTLDMYIKIGNHMRTTIQAASSDSEQNADNGDSVKIGGLMSTMMMPPEPLFRLETYLSNTLPKIESLRLESSADNGKAENALVFSGSGKIVCQIV